MSKSKKSIPTRPSKLRHYVRSKMSGTLLSTSVLCEVLCERDVVGRQVLGVWRDVVSEKRDVGDVVGHRDVARETDVVGARDEKRDVMGERDVVGEKRDVAGERCSG